MKGNVKYNQVDNMSHSPKILVCLLSKVEVNKTWEDTKWGGFYKFSKLSGRKKFHNLGPKLKYRNVCTRTPSIDNEFKKSPSLQV